MTLQKMTITGFRGFANETSVEFAIPNGTPGSGLTLITGPNNSGKSTIIEALKIRSTVNQAPSFNIGMRNTNTDSVTIEYHVNGSIETLASSRAGSSESAWNNVGQMTPYVVGSRRQFAQEFGRTPLISREDYVLQSGSQTPFRQVMLTGFEGRLFEIERNHAEFDKLLFRVVPEFMEWSIDQYESRQYFIKLKSTGKYHSLSGSGDGLISVFVIIAAIFDSKPGDIIAIDEPELSLHPEVQKRLVKIINEYSVDRQIIIATHSPYFIDIQSLLNGARIVRTWDRAGTIEIYDLSVDTCESLKRLLSPNENNPHVFGLDAREIFFSGDPILVFEGQEDVVFWPKVVGFMPALSQLSVYGWGAGGAANMKNVVTVLQRLGYHKVAGVLDNNRPQDLDSLRNEFPEYFFMEIPASDIRSKRASNAKPEVIGLLDDSGSVRTELLPQLNSRLSELAAFFDLQPKL